jgi:hypothetical protein
MAYYAKTLAKNGLQHDGKAALLPMSTTVRFGEGRVQAGLPT